MQLSMFAPVKTVASPICVYMPPCPRKGRAVLGEPVESRECINRSILCLTCKAYGVLSQQKD